MTENLLGPYAPVKQWDWRANLNYHSEIPAGYPELISDLFSRPTRRHDNSLESGISFAMSAIQKEVIDRSEFTPESGPCELPF